MAVNPRDGGHGGQLRPPSRGFSGQLDPSGELT